MEDKKCLILTDKGLIGIGKKDPKEIIATLLIALLNVWNDSMRKIDIDEAAEKVIDVLEKLDEPGDEEEGFGEDFLKALSYLFGNDGEDKKDGKT